MGEVTEDEVAVAKERGLEVEPEEVTELLQSHDDKTLTVRTYFLWVNKTMVS